LRGYFGIGVEGISKTMNVGTLMRTAHAFGAGFVFTVAAVYSEREGGKSDTSDAPGHVPFYEFPDVAGMVLPEGCELVGVELLDGAADLPSFRHPRRAAYVLGPERGVLSPAMIERCAYTVKIPMQFCVNLGIAGAIVMYDRLLNLGRFQPRPLTPGGGAEALPEHEFGPPVLRRQMERHRAKPPAQPTNGEGDDAPA
jgi:tRNA G18 (ribose-2'-O)-methylase SpoU|tara:strand:- start:180 stop:773 length:594 start_codon:yes stop_codon:yes gene_type:complete